MMKYLIRLCVFFYLLNPLHAQELTYYKDIEPIIQNKCAACHHDGGGAPFSLLTFDDVSKRASFIKEVVNSGYMPPWKPDNNYTHFANDRSLTPTEISRINKWIDDKKPTGEQTVETKAVKTFLSTTKYTRQPDLVLKTADSFKVKGDNSERFVVFKIPFELPGPGNVEAVEFVSNNKKVIHHANYEIHEIADTGIDIYNTDPFINLTEDDRSKYEQYKPYRKTITYYGGWIPGTTYEYYPKEFGWIMPKRGVILLTVHFGPTPIDYKSISGINLFFKSTPITRPVKVISFGSGGLGQKQITPDFYINPNEQKTFTLELTNPGADLSVMYVWPHMHYIGKEFTAYIVKPGGDTVKLVHIPAWDFRWQEIYRFPKFVKVPKGSVMHIIGTYDNSASNPANPFNPPQTIMSVGDMRSTDEMMTLLMIYLPYKEGDENINLE